MLICYLTGLETRTSIFVFMGFGWVFFVCVFSFGWLGFLRSLCVGVCKDHLIERI